MDLASLISQLRRSFKVEPNETPISLNLRTDKAAVESKTLHEDRPLSELEYAIAKWLLTNADPPACSFIPQLDVARVTGRCSCGCPTVDLEVPEEVLEAEPRDNPFGNAIGEVNGNMVGLMLWQSGGYLTGLEVYDLSEIERPYGLPSLDSLRPFET